MCIVILDKSHALSDETLTNCYNANRDGFGLSYANNGELIVAKGVKPLTEIIQLYNDAKMDAQGPILLHFRIKTSGLINDDMCHPFLVSSRVAFAHNGIIPITHDRDESDTFAFTESILKNLPINFLRSKKLMNIVKCFVGSTNKLVFLDNANNYKIINEEKGTWENNDSVWYSNDSYKTPEPIKVPRFSTKYKNTNRGIYTKERLCTRCNALLAFPEELATGLCFMCDVNSTLSAGTKTINTTAGNINLNSDARQTTITIRKDYRFYGKL